MIDLEELKKLALAATRYPGYTVDRDGNVWSSSNWRGYGIRKLKPFPNSDGYPSVKVRSNGRMKKALVHVLVCEAFHGPKPTPEHQVRHVNGVRADCRAENLAWGTASENAIDRKAHGTEKAAENGRRGMAKTIDKLRRLQAEGKINFARGERAGMASITDEQARTIKSLIGSGPTQREIAKQFGVSEHIVSRIKRGLTWTHV